MVEVLVPEIRKLHKINKSKSRSVVLPKHVVDYWCTRFGEVEEVEVHIDNGRVVICPRGTYEYTSLVEN